MTRLTVTDDALKISLPRNGCNFATLSRIPS
jgi:hypothetical protein